MTNLSRHDRRLAERLRPQRLEFDDLTDMDDAALARVFAAAGPEVSRLALAGASPALLERMMRQLSPADGKRMRRAIEKTTPLRLADVEGAQREVAQVARELALVGQIDLPDRERLLAAA